jgi:hypothetical protein
MATPLDPYAGVPKDTTAQLVYLADAVGRAEAPLVLHTQQAVNEYEHAGFALSSRGPVSGLHFRSTDLLSKAGDRLPAAQVRVSAIGYLEPDPGYDPSYDCWNGVPQPDLVEEVRGEFALAACESRQFWLTVNSAGSAPGDYEGRLEIAASAPALSRVLPVRVEVWPVVLPQRPRLDVFLFAGIPWPGRSAELWADFLVEHYVSRVAIEQPGDIFVGEQRIEAAGREVKDIELEGGIAGREVTIRGERWGHLERLKTIRSRGLKLDLYSGRGIIKTVLWPAYVEYLARAGFSRADFRYKISDEDMDPWSLPIYQAFKGIDPDLDLVLCPAESWDITPYRPYVDTYMCSHSVTAWAQWLPYFREEQTRGKRLAVYTNWPSWAGRAPLEQVRRDLSWIWQIGADEYDAWAIDIDVPTGFTYPYGGRLRDVTGLATEKQTIAGLIYFRRDGDLFRPVSCKRLEAIRDGVKDWLYLDCLATLLARLPAEAQPAYRKVLDDALAAAGQSRADFCRRKLLLAKAIRALEQPGSPAGQGGK